MYINKMGVSEGEEGSDLDLTESSREDKGSKGISKMVEKKKKYL